MGMLVPPSRMTESGIQMNCQNDAQLRATVVVVAIASGASGAVAVASLAPDTWEFRASHVGDGLLRAARGRRQFVQPAVGDRSSLHRTNAPRADMGDRPGCRGC
jgi:hypothetical protein